MLTLTKALQQSFILNASKGRVLASPTITYINTPVNIPEDYATLQAALDAEVVGKTWASSTTITGTVSSTIGSEAVTGSGTAFLSEVSADTAITMDGETYIVRDVTDDANLRLWAGADKTSSGVAGVVKVPTKVTLLTANADNTLQGTVPDGVSLQIVGTDIYNKWTGVAATSLVHSDFAIIEIHNLTLEVVASIPALVTSDTWGIGATARGVFRASRLNCLNQTNETVGWFLIQGSAVEISYITAQKWKANFICDYLNVDNVGSHNAIDDDVMLMAIPASATARDIAYSHDVSNYAVHKHVATIGTANFNGGLEWNTWAASKVANITDTYCVTNSVGAGAGPSYPVWLSASGGGTFNFTDCTFDTNSAVEEIVNRSVATVNLTNAFRLDGTTDARVA